MNQQYPCYPSDVVEEKYETEPRRPRSSAKRYQPGDYRGAATMPVAQRSSLQRSSRSGRSTNGRDDYRPDDINSAQTERLSPTWQLPVQPSKAVKPLPSRVHHPLQQSHWVQRYIAKVFGGGMCAALLLAFIGWHIVTWWCNALADPLSYTQSAHRDTVIVTLGGYRETIRAIVDDSGHLDALILPSDMSKPQIIQGPALTNFAHPEHAMLEATVTDHGTAVILSAQGPFDDGFLPTRPLTQSWHMTINQKPQGQK